MRLAFLFAVILVASPVSYLASEPVSNSIFKFVPNDSVPYLTRESVLRGGDISDYRIVQVDLDTLRELARDSVNGESFVAFPMIDGTSVSLSFNHVQESPENPSVGFAQFSGYVVGDSNSSAGFVVTTDGVLHLNVRTRGAEYTVVQTRVPKYFLYAVNYGGLVPHMNSLLLPANNALHEHT